MNKDSFSTKIKKFNFVSYIDLGDKSEEDFLSMCLEEFLVEAKASLKISFRTLGPFFGTSHAILTKVIIGNVLFPKKVSLVLLDESGKPMVSYDFFGVSLALDTTKFSYLKDDTIHRFSLCGTYQSASLRAFGKSVVGASERNVNYFVEAITSRRGEDA